QTRIEMRGELDAGNVWKVHVRGSSFDGRNMFRTLLSAGKINPPAAQLPANAPGLDVDAEIDRVIGFFDTTLDTLKLTASRRKNALVALDAHGQLNGDRPFAARLEQEAGGPRVLVAQATDAGAAFRLVGFYPSARGGEASLNMNLDEGRDKQRVGNLYAQNFVIVQDQVVKEVLSSSQASARSRNQPLLQFDRMHVPFAIGGGRFIVKDALINGPVLGATMRGSIDFASENISLSGTYVPLYGINGALGFLPILGELLVGRDGEGLFGITFAVRGKTSKPDVLVNPVSLVAPGFLRQIFEFNQPPQPRVPQRQPAPQAENFSRSSSEPPTTQ
ncbi:MAG TPA: AsmA-like C-terminal region-containing protein, partial [Hyphomicrobiales bacterium]|nr:AsmA-like C-terminal region-containing protein [Hyphomicrobiales bacterium]